MWKKGHKNDPTGTQLRHGLNTSSGDRPYSLPSFFQFTNSLQWIFNSNTGSCDQDGRHLFGCKTSGKFDKNLTGFLVTRTNAGRQIDEPLIVASEKGPDTVDEDQSSPYTSRGIAVEIRGQKTFVRSSGQ